MNRLLTTTIVTAGILLAAAGIKGALGHPASPLATPWQANQLSPADLQLAPFASCDALLDHLQTEALKRVTPWGLPGNSGPHPPRPIMFDEMAVEDAAPPRMLQRDGAIAAEAPQEGVDYSGTNVQEAGADEPDILKTDGRMLVTVVEGDIRIVDLTGSEPEEKGEIDLPNNFGNPQLLLEGDQLLVLGNRAGWRHRPMPTEDVMIEPARPGYAPYSPVTLLLLYDISNPADPEVVSETELDGRYLSSRLINGVAHAVITSQPTGLEFKRPRGGGLRNEREALAANKEIIRNSEIGDWLPYQVSTENQTVETEGALLDCENVYKPETFAGFGMLTLLSIDLRDGNLEAESGTGVLTQGETVYASTERLYVTTNEWIDWGRFDEPATVERMRDVVTDIHAFDLGTRSTSRRSPTRYIGSGTVPGTLLNQFAMSEHDGHLRVATTEGEAWWGRSDSESTVTVLEVTGDGLIKRGEVTGLGRTERIYAVRFMGDMGYVVTFRQTDPLYVLDLSDPSNPSLEGELKIPGYSAYLHPAGEGRLIGVGQDADDTGRVRGLQISLFDVSDPANPRRIRKQTLSGANSEAEMDHHAFLYWPATGTTVLPVRRYGGRSLPRPLRDLVGSFDDRPFTGAVVFTITDDRIEAEGRIRHDAPRLGSGAGFNQNWHQTQIRRSLVVGDQLYTFSDASLVGVDLHSLNLTSRLDW